MIEGHHKREKSKPRLDTETLEMFHAEASTADPDQPPEVVLAEEPDSDIVPATCESPTVEFYTIEPPPSTLDHELYGHDLFGGARAPKPSGPLAEKFDIPPFSVLDTRQGYWQERKKAWLALGIQSELGRGNDTQQSGAGSCYTGTSSWSGDRGPARAFREDLMRGERPYETANAKQGLTFNTTLDPYDREGVPNKASDKVKFAGGNLLGFSDRCTIRRNGQGFDGGAILRGKLPPGQVEANGTSIFDPMLCEIVYRWFCPAGGLVVDPFAGGSVRGILAAKLGRSYLGIDLRPEQVAANYEQAERLCHDADLRWLVGDALDLAPTVPPCDFVFSCPPYADLERYSEDPRDLSTMTYENFSMCYQSIIASCLQKLRDDRFAVFVVSEVREKASGFYRRFVHLTVDAFEAAGARYYNEAVLVNVAGSLPLRVGIQFRATRKLGRTHQYVLVFCKGDPRKAAAACRNDVVDTGGELDA